MFKAQRDLYLTVSNVRYCITTTSRSAQSDCLMFIYTTRIWTIYIACKDNLDLSFRHGQTSKQHIPYKSNQMKRYTYRLVGHKEMA